ncbi:hypothetical protein F5X68DRAFT_51498 [Plectosphaerella plurivora]|uniref:Zn(2)-C6 fungal-type domain-containing protein n=1 Tax=Plectosphaerella plurivora TaxID=936078 RepID=A0A9P9A7M7_9PEZI|nr:hypothetical protein F5X68DRAFT_51498 [Plectosphaerella plurivora]
MAGPGGGPPRRSHTKSRKGCDACKRRHIRCDESFPQCRNCTKHKIRCPYNDMPVPEDRSTTPDKPDLMWTQEIVANIELWQRTNTFPFPALQVFPAPDASLYSFEDLRLIYHLASICGELDVLGANNFTVWTRQIPALISIASTHRYVMDALLAFSAMHIASLTDCPAVGNLSFEHRGAALKGLHTAINNLSNETSDAVLACSFVLSWQATDWRSWVQHMQGTTAVMEFMEPWKHTSQFIDFINESCTFPTAPASPNPDRKPKQPSKDDMDALSRTLVQLQKIESHLKHQKENTKDIQQLISFLKGSRKVSQTLAVAEQFERLRPLRTWLFNLPVTLLQKTGGSPNALVVIAHYYTVALLMEQLFPEIGTAYFGSMSIGPIEDIARHIHSLNLNGACDSLPLALMEFPINTVSEFRTRMGWGQPPRTPSFPQFNVPNFYATEQLALAPVTESYMPYGTPSFSYSHESVNLLNADSAPGSAVSPLSLSSSPFPHPQYLGVPSPNNYGSYSPASSTFESPLGYGDDEYEYGSYDISGMPGMPSGHMFDGPNGTNFGGFVSPIQPVWN